MTNQDYCFNLLQHSPPIICYLVMHQLITGRIKVNNIEFDKTDQLQAHHVLRNNIFRLSLPHF